jgi:hypothetical protein
MDLSPSSYKFWGAALIHNNLDGFRDEIETFIPADVLFYAFNHQPLLIHYTDIYLGRNIDGSTYFPLLAVAKNEVLAHEFAHLVDALYMSVFGVFMRDHALFRPIVDNALGTLPTRAAAYYKDRSEVFARVFEIGYSREVWSVKRNFPKFGRFGKTHGPHMYGYEFENKWEDLYREAWLDAIYATIGELAGAAKKRT